MGLDQNLQVGYGEFSGVSGSGNAMALKVKDSATGGELIAVLDENLAFGNDGMTHHLFLRFDLSNDDAEFGGIGDRIRVFLDPMGETEPEIASADISGIDFLADRMGTISTFVFGAGTAPAFDELRVATEFYDVRTLDSAPSIRRYLWVIERFVGRIQAADDHHGGQPSIMHGDAPDAQLLDKAFPHGIRLAVFRQHAAKPFDDRKTPFHSLARESLAVLRQRTSSNIPELGHILNANDQPLLVIEQFPQGLADRSEIGRPAVKRAEQNARIDQCRYQAWSR